MLASTAAGRGARHASLDDVYTVANPMNPSGTSIGNRLDSVASPQMGFAHPGAASSTLTRGNQSNAMHHGLAEMRSLPASQRYQHHRLADSRMQGQPRPFNALPGVHGRRTSNLNPNAQAFQAKSLFSVNTDIWKPNPSPQTFNPTEPATERQENDLGIDPNKFDMESFDRKGKGRSLSKNNSTRPSVLMSAPASNAVFEERADGYTTAIQREMDMCPPRSVEMPNLFWRLGIRLPPSNDFSRLPQRLEELWVLRERINRQLRGAQTWVRMFNEDVAHMRITNHPLAADYAKWGEPFMQQSVGVEVPSWTLELRGIEEAMMTCMKQAKY